MFLFQIKYLSLPSYLKKVQSKTDSGVKEILTPEQYEKYQVYKEAKKDQK